MLRIHSYRTLNQGPHLLLLGAVHGNEICGPLALQKLLSEIDEGRLTLQKGSLTCVPITNPLAYEKGVRYIERNLNRYLVPKVNPTLYEEKISNVLCPILENCDYLLDIHSNTAGGPPYVFAGMKRENEYRFAASLGPFTLLTGMHKTFAEQGRKNSVDDKNEGIGTTDYSRRFGALALTLECGQHQDPQSPLIAYSALREALHYLGIIHYPSSHTPTSPQKIIYVHNLYYQEDQGHFTQNWKNLDPVNRDQVIAIRADGTALKAPDDGFVILPKSDALIGNEWFYFGSSQPPIN